MLYGKRCSFKDPEVDSEHGHKHNHTHSTILETDEDGEPIEVDEALEEPE